VDKAARKTAIADYKKREAIAGIYAVRCSLSGRVWVGRTMDLEKVQTRLWFGLRTAGNQHPAMQADWTTYGEESFSFEALEPIEAEELAYVRDAILKERLDHWRSKLGAGVV